jgi:hypothetical protein
VFGWILILAVVAWVGVMTVRIFPVWYECRIVRTTLNSLSESGEFRRPSVAGIVDLVRTRLSVNYVQPQVLDEITFERHGDSYEASYRFERVVPLAGNVSLLWRCAGGTGPGR